MFESPKVAALKEFLARKDNDTIDWVMLATNLALEVAQMSELRRDWPYYYLLKDHRDQMKKDIQWTSRNRRRTK